MSSRMKTVTHPRKPSIRSEQRSNKKSSPLDTENAPNQFLAVKSEDHENSTPESRLEMKDLKGLLGFQLRQASFLFSHLYADHLNDLGLSPLEFSILEVVNMNPGVTAQQICNALNLRAPNAVKLIQTLSEQQLIERQPHPHDRRAFGIVLTSKGMTLTTQALEHLSRLEKIGFKGLNERQKTALLRQLELINSNANKTYSKLRPAHPEE